jgi:membrane-associated phospholipid phosphatase
MTPMRQFNIWLLDHADIHTSVCPSGHVAAASSAALAMLVALPERKSIGGALFVLASVIALATVYGRYHYAVDVMASIALSLAAWGAMAWATRGGRRGA